MKSAFFRKFSYIVLVVGVASALADCSVISPSSYDGQSDTLITELQTNTDTLLVNLASYADQISSLSDKDDPVSISAISRAVTAASYPANAASYDRIKVILDTLKIRVDALGGSTMPQLDNAIQQVNNTLFGPDGLMSAHETAGYLPRSTIVRFQAILDQEFATLLGIELGG